MFHTHTYTLVSQSPRQLQNHAHHAIGFRPMMVTLNTKFSYQKQIAYQRRCLSAAQLYKNCTWLIDWIVVLRPTRHKKDVSEANLLAWYGKTKPNTKKHAFNNQKKCTTTQNKHKLEVWTNAQRDGRPAEYRWHPLLNAAKFGWRPLLECRAVMLTRCETHWNLLGCPKLTNRSQPLMGRVHHIVRTCGGDIAV